MSLQNSEEVARIIGCFPKRYYFRARWLDLLFFFLHEPLPINVDVQIFPSAEITNYEMKCQILKWQGADLWRCANVYRIYILALRELGRTAI